MRPLAIWFPWSVLQQFTEAVRAVRHAFAGSEQTRVGRTRLAAALPLIQKDGKGIGISATMTCSTVGLAAFVPRLLPERHGAVAPVTVLGHNDQKDSDETLTFRLPLDDRRHLPCLSVQCRHASERWIRAVSTPHSEEHGYE